MVVPVEQLPLLVFVNEDHLLLSQDPQNLWFHILERFPWKAYRQLAATYYDALYHFNQTQQKKNELPSMKHLPASLEIPSEAKQRLMFERATLNPAAPVLYQPEPPPPLTPSVDPDSLAPGVVPMRLAGKEPKCFFALFKAFMGVMLMGLPPEPDYVHLQLSTNPSFARVCGFEPKGHPSAYAQEHVPSVRKLQQFDQIMTEYGLWSKQKIEEIRLSIESGVIKPEAQLVGDTTHYHAYSTFETISYVNEKGELERKSQSKLTKRCRCQDREHCTHPWELADDGAGTIVKSTSKIVWGHKASILGLPEQGIPLDAVAVADAATHDSKTLIPHLARLQEQLPEVKGWVTTVLYDSACDDQALREQCHNDFGLELKTSINPRRRKSVTEGLPRGMDVLTPYGELYCHAGREMEYQGVRFDSGCFIYGPPKNEFLDHVFCQTCLNKDNCCPHANKGRVVTIPFDLLSHIDPHDPPMSKRFKAMMTRRPAIERIIKRLKCDLSDECLTKRGNASFQAYLDKTMIAFHILLRG